MARIKAEFDDANLSKRLRTFAGRVNRQVGVLMNYEAGYAESWLKTNAPWHDDTGAARSGLKTMAFSQGNKHEILMSYSVYYGIWLEVAHSGKWAVIVPGMRIIGNKVMNDIQALIVASARGGL